MGEFQFTHSGEQRRRRTAHRGSARQGLFAAAGTGGTHIHDTRGPQDIAQMLRAANALPTNLGFMGRGKANRPEALHQQDAGIAEDILHDLGAISMISSDSQAMGRVGEVTIRGWQTAHKMKTLRGALPGDGAKNDYFRTKRYIAKLTINPARAQGIAHEVGSLEPGKWADIVFWRPTFFGVKPSLVMKGGFIAAAAMGDANASIPTPQPVHYRPMFGAFGGVLSRTSLTFVSQAALANGAAESYGLHKRLASVKACRTVKKTDMVHNDYLPVMQIDAQTYEVRADGQLLTCEPASVLPMAQRYFLF